MRAHEAVARGLADLGVRRIFGLMGDANMQFIAEYVRDHAGDFVSAVDERGAVAMADADARVTGEVAVAAVTHGPGVTNALTSVTEAARARTGLVLLVGETPPEREHLQRLDLRAAAGLAGASYLRCHDAGDVTGYLALALRTARADRLPVLLDLPVAMLDSDIGYTTPQPAAAFSADVAEQRIAPDPRALDRALGIAASASRPLILAGRGALQAGAREELARLSARLNAPLATTLLARDYFRGHPLDLGISGTLSHSVAAAYLQAADCVISFGAGLNRFTTVGGNLLRGKPLIQIDNDARAIGLRHPPAAAVLGDARVVAETMVETLGDLDGQPTPRWLNSLAAQLRALTPEAEYRDRGDSRTLDMRAAMVLLDRLLPAERNVVTDVGRFHPAPWRFMHCEPERFCPMASFGSIGLGIAASIGAAIARPDVLTVGVVGDGGGMMGLVELATAARRGAKLLVLVLDDGAYGAEYRKLADFGIDPKYSLTDWPDFAAVASSLGVEASVARCAADLEIAAERVAAGRLPYLLDIKANPAVEPTTFL